MQKRKLNNQTLDAIGRKLFESDVLAGGEIDRIVSNPNLFALVVAKIESEVKKPVVTSAAVPFFRRNALRFAGAAAVVLFAVGASSLFRPEKTPVVARIVQIPDAVPEVARPVLPPQGIVEKSSPGRALKADFRTERLRPVRRVKNRPMPNIEFEANGEFYPIAYTGELGEADGGRIIRVDMKAASLFALGVNLPLENYEATIKTDLLVGSDSVTRGVRLVN